MQGKDWRTKWDEVNRSEVHTKCVQKNAVKRRLERLSFSHSFLNMVLATSSHPKRASLAAGGISDSCTMSTLHLLLFLEFIGG